MKVDAIRKIAGQHNIKANGLKKQELIHAIQRAEGNTPCFNSITAASCDQQGCCWREDCR